MEMKEEDRVRGKREGREVVEEGIGVKGNEGGEGGG